MASRTWCQMYAAEAAAMSADILVPRVHLGWPGLDDCPRERKRAAIVLPGPDGGIPRRMEAELERRRGAMMALGAWAV
ncbi:hypothetical protein NDU88_011492 [Pleurodeles waltl]|uniref:Uncharacterized protein n=1 Tax=Pleurodeles waltl TaxID=8319 RepID=A0AAV7QXS4_PLEWA|nr:hypothetical protein NDU88_011492 [Pleurodeles waltl]